MNAWKNPGQIFHPNKDGIKDKHIPTRISKHRTKKHPNEMSKQTKKSSQETNGCFQKWGYPQIINFNRVFHYKPSILGYPYFWKHPYKQTKNQVTLLVPHHTWQTRLTPGRRKTRWKSELGIQWGIWGETFRVPLRTQTTHPAWRNPSPWQFSL